MQNMMVGILIFFTQKKISIKRIFQENQNYTIVEKLIFQKNGKTL